jgi:hypothetical protein
VTIRTTYFQRFVSFLVYAFLAGAGAGAVLAPPAAMQATSAHVVITVWAALMFGGGSAGMYSVVSGNILPELVGLPALIGGVLVFVIVLGIRVSSGALPSVSGSVILALLLVGFAGLLLLRAIELRALIRAVERGK